MTVEDLDKIDIIAMNKEGTRLSLVITDHLEWDSEGTRQHLLLLQDKINLYYAYLQSEAFASDYPDAAQLELAIEVVNLYRPNDSATEFLEAIGVEMAKDGYMFIHRVSDK